MSHSISQNFNGRTLLKFAFPTIIMMVFMSMYTMVDGFFVSRFVGADALSAINIVYPLIGLVVGMGIMLGTGGSAVIARQLGLGQAQEARKNFTRILVFGLILGILFTIVSMVFLEPLLKLLGSSERLMGYCREYMIILLPFMAVQMLQTILGVLFVTAGKPNLGLGLTILSGLANMILDYIFIAVLDWGIGGAALATAVGYSIMPVYAFFYFLKPRTELFLVKASFQGEVLWESCLNGSSEMVSNLAASVITWLMNLLMMHFAGEDGVAAVTVVLYTQLFPFGFGLSYTEFTYRDLVIEKREEKYSYRAAVKVRNAGERFGTEVVQLYINDLLSSVVRPDRLLKGFCRVDLEPGEEKEVEFLLDFDSFKLLNLDMEWVVEPGEFEIIIGSSSADTGLSRIITVEE